MFAIAKSNGIVVDARRFEIVDDDAKAAIKALAVETQQTLKFVNVYYNQKGSFRTVVIKPDHRVFAAFGKPNAKGVRKQLKVGTYDEVRTYCLKVIRKGKYNPIVKVVSA